MDPGFYVLVCNSSPVSVFIYLSVRLQVCVSCQMRQLPKSNICLANCSNTLFILSLGNGGGGGPGLMEPLLSDGEGLLHTRYTHIIAFSPISVIRMVKG